MRSAGSPARRRRPGRGGGRAGSPSPSSPLPAAVDLPGPRILGFVACGAVVRRAAFREAGGFDAVVHFAGEEERVAIDLAAAGWGLAPSSSTRPTGGRPVPFWAAGSHREWLT